MKTPIHLLFGGITEEWDDYQDLKDAVSSKKSLKWSALKKIRAGDRVLVYCTQPLGGIVASAEAMEDAAPGQVWDYETTLDNIRMIDPPIKREQIRRMFPKWAWPKATRGQTYMDQEVGEQLWRRFDAGRDLVPPKVLPTNGAGFGASENNPLVEKAAVKSVTSYLTSKGYTIKSREAEKIGYDLEATKGREVLHVEVKGISGGVLQFPITANEMRLASEDKAFRLFAVTHALTKQARLHEFKGADFLNRFSLAALSYMAKLK
jgi:hypothetical protein